MAKNDLYNTYFLAGFVSCVVGVIWWFFAGFADQFWYGVSGGYFTNPWDNFGYAVFYYGIPVGFIVLGLICMAVGLYKAKGK